MANTTIINKFGNVIGWNRITVNVLGRDVEGITKLMYNDNIDIEGVKGAGKYDIGYGEGNYTCEASITLTEEERRAILEALPQDTRIQEIAPFDINISYEYNNKVYKDVIRNCKFRNNGIEANQGDKSLAFEFELYTSHIEWNKR